MTFHQLDGILYWKLRIMKDIMEEDTYYVNLHVGPEATDCAVENDDIVSTVVSRQMLCDMTANIEFNTWALNCKLSLQDRKRRSRDGISECNQNYLISGVRGSGKTTFLNFLIRCLTRDIDPFAKDEKYQRYSAEHYIGCSRKKVNCQLLYRYDPSAPGSSASSFLISVVAAIQSLLEKYRQKPRAEYEDYSIAEMDCRRVLRALDKGISRLSRTATPLKDLSVHEVINLRVEDAVLEEQIRSNFHHALESLCRIFGIDAFIVAIDDADTRFSHCANVIEDLRLYMTHPRLIVLLAGDRDLYLERIREFHFKEYDMEYHEADAKGKDYRMDFVMNHASQYLIKLFPLANQYELRDVAYLSRKIHPIHCRLKTVLRYDDKEQLVQMELTTFVRQVLKTVINSNTPELEHYVNLFLSMPLRTLLQVVNAWVLDDVWSNLETLESNKKDIEAMLAKPDSELTDADDKKVESLVGKRETIKKRVRNIVKNTLYAAWESEIRVSDYQFDKIELDDSRGFFPLMLQLCIHMNDVDHGFFLSGDAGSSLSDRRVMMLLALASGNHLTHLEEVLSYLLFGPATVALFAKAIEQDRWEKTDRRPGAKEELSDLFFRYFQVSNRISPTRWARHANMLWGFDPGREGLHTGVLRLRYTDMVDDLNSTIFKNDAETDGSRPDEREKMKKMLAFLGSMGHSEARDNSYYISIFGLFGFILKCLRCCRQCKAELAEVIGDSAPDEAELKKQATDALCDLLYSAAPIKSCRDPEWLIPSQRHEGFNKTTLTVNRDDFFADGRTYSPILRSIAEEIYTWYRDGALAENRIPCDDISPQKMGDLWANLYYRLKGVCYSRSGARMRKEVTVPGLESLAKQILTMVEIYESVFFEKAETGVPITPSEARTSKRLRRKKRSQYYREEIGRFPLTKAFCEGCRDFASKLGERAKAMRRELENQNAPSSGTATSSGGVLKIIIQGLSD